MPSTGAVKPASLADSKYWQDRTVQLGELEVLVERVCWHKGGWKIEAWIPAPEGEGTYLRDGRWYIHPWESTAKRAIHTAFPEARGEWDGYVLTETPPADPEK
jgi:hypothetical protein